jgi:hypothetical protein
MKTITKNQYYQLVGLAAISKRQYDLLDQVMEAALEITGEDRDNGHTSDFVYSGDHDVKDLLERLSITVEPTSRAVK